MRSRWLSLALLGLVGCRDPGQDRAVQPSQPSQASASSRADGTRGPVDAPLVARFETSDASFPASTQASLAFVVENRGTTPVQLDLDTLGSAILSLDVFDARGERVLTIPPGMPPANYQPAMETLAPGASRRFVQDLHVFMPPLPAGSYTARVRWRGLQSDTARFTID